MTAPDHNPTIPYHLGIIPDGNRRWAKNEGLPALEGHRRGMEVSKEIALAAFDRGVKVMTMFAFSTENWQRTEEEIGWLMDIFHGFFTREFRELERKEVRFRFAGSRDRLSDKMLKAVDDLEARTAHLTAGTLVICLNYGGHQEIVEATARIVQLGVAPENVTAELLAENMYAPEVPGIDLIIRTSHEQRLSGFMLWRSDYAELAFIDKHWPAFNETDLDSALADYAERHRRFGK